MKFNQYWIQEWPYIFLQKIQGSETSDVHEFHTSDLEIYQFPLQSFNSVTCTKDHEHVAFIATCPTTYFQ
jgi:hypothetical protein